MAVIVGNASKEYISSLNFMDKRDYLNQVLDVTNESSTLVDALEFTDRVKTTEVPSYIHLENVKLFKAAAVNAVSVTASLVGDAAGESIEFTITAGTNSALPVKGELAMFTSKKIGIVTSVVSGTLTVTVKPLSTSTILNPSGTTVVNGQNVIFFSAAAAEGSDDPDVRQPEWIQSKNNIQIFKEAGEITDLQKVSAVEVTYGGKPYVMYKVQHDAYTRHKMKISNALLFGQKSAVVDGDGKTAYTTQGLRASIFGGDGDTKLTGGITEQYSTLDKADIRSLNRKLDKNMAPDEYWGYVGGDLWADIDDLLMTFDGVKYGQSFVSFGSGANGGRDKAVSLGFDSFKMYGRTFHMNKMKLLDHSGLFGATGFDFASEAYFIPTDKIKIDAGGGTSDRILMRVMAGDGTNFYPHMETVTGKLAPTPTNTKSVLHVSYQTIAGLQVCGTDHFACLYK
jgi:hypothetical protein